MITRVFIRIKEFLKTIFCKMFYLKHAIAPPHSSLQDTFREQHSNKFTKTFTNSIDWSKNIEPIFHDRKTFKELIKVKLNEIESVWRQRVLFQVIPQGQNVIMHYDAFREGFAYYADQSSIPYSILNAIAMNYCMKFLCRDFFIDESILEGSRFIKYIKDDIEEENQKKKKVKVSFEGNSNDDSESVFVSRKKKVVVPPPIMKPLSKCNNDSIFSFFRTNRVESKSIEKTMPIVNEPPDLVINKFIYMGRIRNFSILQRIESSSKKETITNKEHMSYKSFKHAMFLDAEEKVHSKWEETQQCKLVSTPDIQRFSSN